MAGGRINIIVAANNKGAVTRLVAEYANHLTKCGYDVTVSYPAFNYWHNYLWQLRDIPNSRLVPHFQDLRRIIYPLLKYFIWSLFQKNRWLGEKIYEIDGQVEMNPYLFVPTGWNMPDADYIICLQEYIIPQLLYLPKSKGEIIGSIHLDYMNGINDSNKGTSEWWKYVVEIDRKVNVPTWTTSRRSLESCEKLGIRVDRLIYNGVDANLLSDGNRRGRIKPLRLMLYCDSRPNKGRASGVSVVRKLKEIYPPEDVIFCSLGEIPGDESAYFDINLGFLHGNEYIESYRKSDIFLFPSLYEGFPAPPLDAMACGCALVTTKVPGVEDYAEHGINCMLSEPADEEAMIHNIKLLIDDQALRDRLRENGLATVKRLSWDKSTEELIKFINETTSKVPIPDHT